jgi:peptide/nickel transport system permease protein
MVRFFLRRFAFLLLTLFFTSIVIFALTRILPGDVCSITSGGLEASPNVVAQCERELGLDEPLLVQYVNWLLDFVQGDFGVSAINREPIAPVLEQRLENSARLASLTLLLSVPLGILLGVIAGLNENKLPDAIISVITLGVVSLPEFVTSIFLINILAPEWTENWDFTPFDPRISATQFEPQMSFWESMPFIIFPAIATTFVLLGYIARLTRAGVIEELKRDYVRTAELKGLPYWQVIIKHILRNALLPTVTVIAISIGWLMSGLVVVEFIFNYDGVGSYLVDGIDKRDLTRIQAITMTTVFIFVFINFLADLMYAYLNPRIRFGD